MGAGRQGMGRLIVLSSVLDSSPFPHSCVSIFLSVSFHNFVRGSVGREGPPGGEVIWLLCPFLFVSTPLLLCYKYVTIDCLQHIQIDENNLLV